MEIVNVLAYIIYTFKIQIQKHTNFHAILPKIIPFS